MNLSRAL